LTVHNYLLSRLKDLYCKYYWFFVSLKVSSSGYFYFSIKNTLEKIFVPAWLSFYFSIINSFLFASSSSNYGFKLSLHYQGQKVKTRIAGLPQMR